MKDEKRFYVYVYLDPRKSGEFVYGEYRFDYEPFYIGRGTGNRDKQHVLELGQKSQQNKNALKQNKLRKIISDGYTPITTRLYDGLSFDESNSFEIRAIKNIGRLIHGDGPLTNVEQGGNGRKDYTVSEETRNKLSAAGRGLKRSDETKERIRNAKIGFRHTVETKEKIRLIRLGSHPKISTDIKSAYRKNHYRLVNTENKEVSIITSGRDMNKYCEQHGLDYRKMKNTLYDIPIGKHRRVQNSAIYIEVVSIEKS